MEIYGQKENSLVGSFKEGQGPQRAVEPVMMMMIDIHKYLSYFLEIQGVKVIMKNFSEKTNKRQRFINPCKSSQIREKQRKNYK